MRVVDGTGVRLLTYDALGNVTGETRTIALPGTLDSVTGDKGTAHYRYVTGITYNDFGQRSGIDYAGGTHADYIYDALHCLAQLTSVSPSGDMHRISYTTDGAGNIGLVQNTTPPVGAMGEQNLCCFRCFEFAIRNSKM